MKRGPRVYFSFRSPFSWLAIHRLGQCLPDAHRQLEFIPYWEPDPQIAAALAEKGAAIRYVPMSKAKHLYILQDTKRLAQALRLPMAWPVDVAPVWELSHLAWLKARRLGAAEPFYSAVVAKRWGCGENISNPAVIRSAAAEAGLDGAALLEAVDDPEIRAEGLDCLVRAFEDDIFGVPYFRSGPHRFWGFDRVNAFVRVLQDGEIPQRAPSRTPAEFEDMVGIYDNDTAGGCG